MQIAEGKTFDPRGMLLGPRDGQPRMLHTMLRIADVDRAADFYTSGLGMALVERIEVPEKAATVLFLGYDDADRGALLELVRYREAEAPVHGTGYGHVAIGVPDVETAFAHAIGHGGAEMLAPGVIAPGGPRCAFIRDPDGYAIELVQTRRAPQAEDVPPFDANGVILGPDDGQSRILHTMLRVTDLGRARRFYIDGLGMTARERIEIDFRGGVTALFVGYASGDTGRSIELTCYHQPGEPYTRGTGYGHVAVGVADVTATVERLTALGFACTETPRLTHPGAPLRAFVRDDDGYDVELIESARL
jgi:lactoylglutathione lyase